MSPAREEYVDAVQQAMAVVVAKHDRDDEAIEFLLEGFKDDSTMASGFLILSEILAALLEGASQNSIASIQQLVVRFAQDKFREST